MPTSGIQNAQRVGKAFNSIHRLLPRIVLWGCQDRRVDVVEPPRLASHKVCCSSPPTEQAAPENGDFDLQRSMLISSSIASNSSQTCSSAIVPESGITVCPASAVGAGRRQRKAGNNAAPGQRAGTRVETVASWLPFLE